jgi:uncharacterized protein YecT (DUF1311 family)
MRNLAVAGCLVISCFACAHGEERISEAYSDCLKLADGTTVAIQDCIRQELERQDRKLNEAYKALMSSTPAQRRMQLRDAQRKWIAFRDADCKYYFDPQGGSAARLASNECVLTLTADRARELDNLKGR